MIIVPLNHGYVMWCDDVDKAEAEKGWFAHKRGNGIYAARKSGGRTLSFHREILGAGPGEDVDHIRGTLHPACPGVLDNRRNNLRKCSKAENGWGHQKPRAGKTSKYRGVCRRERYGKVFWMAQTSLRGVKIHLGDHSEEERAARAYDAFAREKFGEFAQLNFPEAA